MATKIKKWLLPLMLTSLMIPTVLLSAQKCNNVETKHPQEETKFSQQFLSEYYKAKVTEVIDGDTIVTENNNDFTKWRFSGIDTPETRKHAPDGSWEPTTGDQHLWGTKAKEELKRLITENKDFVWVPKNPKKDKYSRSLGKIYLSEQHMLNIDLVTKGLAIKRYISLERKNKYYTSDTTFYMELEKAENQAILNKIGMWSLGTKAYVIGLLY
ncbi:thermonuclease family protein [Mycoplasma sp. 128]|uniref:thermonuclease family protein n=1 Tax=Mycoplasma sp. 3341 TaxID=3447506 RepID=UPI003F65B396